MTDQIDTTITPEEANALRIALIFGDPAMQGDPAPLLEAAKHKLRIIEGSASDKERLRDAGRTPGDVRGYYT